MPDQGDTGLYVYGIAPSSGPALPEGLRGMDGAAVDLVAHAGLAAVVTPIALPRPPGRRRDLLSHSDVLNAVGGDLDVVPLRFGTVLRDEEDVVEELLEARWESLTEMLDRVTDAVQLNLRASYVEERVLAEVVQGSRQIQALRSRTRQLPEGTPHPDVVQLGRLVSMALDDLRREDSRVLVEAVLPLVRESRVRERGNPDHVLDIALLVDREAVPVVEARLEQVAADVHERIRLQLTGPLAPFDFVDDEPWG